MPRCVQGCAFLSLSLHLSVHLCNCAFKSYNRERTSWERGGQVLLKRCRGSQEPRKRVGRPPGKAHGARATQDANPPGSIGLHWHPGRANRAGDLSPADLRVCSAMQGINPCYGACPTNVSSLSRPVLSLSGASVVNTDYSSPHGE